MAITYKLEGTWDKKSKMPSGSEVPNHDSHLDGDEVIRLAKAGVALLVGNAQSVKTGFDKNKAYYRDLHELTKGLVAAEAGSGGSFEIRISKGIHQYSKGVPGIGQMPHITAKFCSSGSVNGPAVHIWLSMSGAAIMGGKQGYSAKAVSASEDGPFVPDIAIVTVPPQHRTRVRGNSFSMADYQVVLMSQKVEKAVGQPV